jgi:Ca2+-binding EF-hand superfamily protein
MLIVILSIGNSDNRDEIYRLDCVFDLMDFNKVGKISFDEMVISVSKPFYDLILFKFQYLDNFIALHRISFCIYFRR